MHRLLKKFFSFAGFLALAASAIAGISSKPAVRTSAETDSNNLGSITISNAKFIKPFDTDSWFIGLWLIGTDYPDVNGTSAVQKNDVFTYIGAEDNFLHMSMNGSPIMQTYMDITMNFYTYHPMIGMCIENSALFETITIDTEFRFPSAEAFNGTAPTYYTLDRSVTITKPYDSFNVTEKNVWSDSLTITAADVYNLGEAGIEENFAYFDFEPGSTTKFVVIVKVTDTDYLKNGSCNQAFAGVAKDDFKTKMKLDGKPLTNYNVSEGLISKWTNPVASYFGFDITLPSGTVRADLHTVEIAEGMMIPSANGIDYYTIKAHYVYTNNVLPFVACSEVDDFIDNYLNNSSATYDDIKEQFNGLTNRQRTVFCEATEVYGASYEKLSTLVAEYGESVTNYSIGGGKLLGKVDVNGIRSLNTTGTDNEYLCFELEPSEVDYPTTQTEIPSTKLGLLKTSLKYLTLKDSSGTVISTSVTDAYFNLNGESTYLCVGLTNLSQAASVSIASEFSFPSYALATGDKSSDTFGYYVLDVSATYFIEEGATHTSGSVNDWALPVVTIIYLNEQGGSMTTYPNEQVDCGAEFTLRGTPERTGYSGYWTVVSPDSFVLEGLHFTAPSKPCTITLKAAYTARSYTLSFDGMSETSVTVTYGSEIGDVLPAVPEKTGFGNGRWTVDGIGISASYIWNFAENKTAYAAYDIATYTVTFETNGGSAVESQTVEYGGTAMVPAEPTKNKAVFSGWYADEACTQEYDFDTVITSDITIYAKWTDCFYVTFDTDGGSLIQTATVLAGGKVTRPENDPTKEGYEFIGWYLDGNEYDFDTVVTSDITLTAHYKATSSSRSGCGGSIIASSAFLTLLSGLGVCLVSFRKKESD